MIVPDGVRHAIVKILDSRNTLLGTGFLIGPRGTILTAKHVLRDHKIVQIGFPESIVANDQLGAPGHDRGRQQILTLEAKRPPDHDSADDWAIVHIQDVAAIPDGTVPVPWFPLGDVESAAWVTHAYAGLRHGEGGPFHGEILGRSQRLRKLELFCEQLRDGNLADAKGLSGAPCIVHGEAVALIVSVPVSEPRAAADRICPPELRTRADARRDGHDRPVVGAGVFAIPLETIFAQTQLLGTEDDDESIDLPWQRTFTEAIEGLENTLQVAAAQAALNPKRPVLGKLLPRRAAREMIKFGIRRTSEVVVSAMTAPRHEPTAKKLMNCAETLWVHRESARHLATIATTEVAGLLETEYDWSAQHHFERAREHYFAHQHGAVPEPWYHVVVPPIHQEPFLESVVASIRQQVAVFDERERRELMRIRRRRWSRSNLDSGTTPAGFDAAPARRILAFVASSPRADLVQRLRTEWSQLVVVFLSRNVLSSEGNSVARVEPVRTTVEEDAAYNESDAAWRRVVSARSVS